MRQLLKVSGICLIILSIFGINQVWAQKKAQPVPSQKIHKPLKLQVRGNIEAANHIFPVKKTPFTINVHLYAAGKGFNKATVKADGYNVPFVSDGKYRLHLSNYPYSPYKQYYIKITYSSYTQKGLPAKHLIQIYKVLGELPKITSPRVPNTTIDLSKVKYVHIAWVSSINLMDVGVFRPTGGDPDIVFDKAGLTTKFIDLKSTLFKSNATYHISTWGWEEDFQFKGPYAPGSKFTIRKITHSRFKTERTRIISTKKKLLKKE